MAGNGGAGMGRWRGLRTGRRGEEGGVLVVEEASRDENMREYGPASSKYVRKVSCLDVYLIRARLERDSMVSRG